MGDQLIGVSHFHIFADATSMSNELTSSELAKGRTRFYLDSMIVFAGRGDDLRPNERICKPSTPLNPPSDLSSLLFPPGAIRSSARLLVINFV